MNLDSYLKKITKYKIILFTIVKEIYFNNCATSKRKEDYRIGNRCLHILPLFTNQSTTKKKIMKKHFTLLSISFAVLMIQLLSSCSTSVDIASRKYNKGFHFAFNNSKNSKGTALPAPTPEAKKAVTTEAQPLTAAENKEAITELVAASENNAAAPAEAQLRKKLAAVNLNKVHRALSKIEKKIAAEPKGIVRVTPDAAGTTDTAGSSIDITALILCIFLGGLGVHRFYLGYIGIGIVQLLTAGGCGIWSLIDLIRIITGDLKKKR